VPTGRRRPAILGRSLATAIVLLAVAAGVAPLLLPGTLIGRDAGPVAAATVFVASYLALAIGRIPGLAVDRAGVLPSDHAFGELLGCPDEMKLTCETSEILGDLAQGSVGPGTRGREQLLCATRRCRRPTP